MAIKKTDNSKHKGLRGVWTEVSTKDELTGKNYLSSFKKGTIKGATLFGTMLVAELGLLTGLEYAANNGDLNYADLAVTTDENFNTDHRFVGVSSGNLNIALVADETRWRVYTAQENEHGTTFTYVSDLEYAASLVSYFSRELAEEYEDLAAGNYHDISDFYDVSSISGIYEEDGLLKRHAHNVWDANGYEGQSLEFHYDNYISDFERAARDLTAENAASIYGFTDDNSPEMRIDETPFYEFEDYVDDLNDFASDAWKVFLLLFGAGTLAMGGACSMDERNSRRKLHEELKKKNQIKP